MMGSVVAGAEPQRVNVIRFEKTRASSRRIVSPNYERPATLPNNDFSNARIARSPEEARKACLLIHDAKGSYVETAFCIRLNGRYFLVMANHGLGANEALEGFTFTAENGRKFRLSDDFSAARQRKVSSSNVVYIGEKRLYLPPSKGDITAFELPNGAIDGVYALERNALLYAHVNDAATVLGAGLNRQNVTPRRCAITSKATKNDHSVDCVWLQVERDERNLIVGDSGSPVVTDDGLVLGMLVELFRPFEPSYVESNRGVAIPIDTIFQSVGRHWRFGYLGASFEDDLVVGSVRKNSPADRAGLKVGDRIAAFDGVPISERHEIQNLIALRGPQRCEMLIERQNRNHRLVVELACLAK